MTDRFRVLKCRQRVEPELVERCRTLPVANISDAMNRQLGSWANLRPMHRAGILCGSAITVRTRPGDNLMLHMALRVATKGDVLVVDAEGDLSHSMLGERMVAFCAARELSGLVINGAVRDHGWIRQQSFPVFAAGVNHRAPGKLGPGEINAPIAISGAVVEPGDLVVGDDDGLISIPRLMARDVVARAEARHRKESETFANIGRGEDDTAAFRQRLLDLGCTFEE